MTSTPPRASRSSKSAPAAAPRTRASALATDVGAAPPSPAPEPGHPALPAPSDPMRQQWVAEAAYFIAERRGFLGGSPEDDWSQAEVQIDRMLAGPPH